MATARVAKLEKIETTLALAYVNPIPDLTPGTRCASAAGGPIVVSDRERGRVYVRRDARDVPGRPLDLSAVLHTPLSASPEGGLALLSAGDAPNLVDRVLVLDLASDQTRELLRVLPVQSWQLAALALGPSTLLVSHLDQLVWLRPDGSEVTRMSWPRGVLAASMLRLGPELLVARYDGKVFFVEAKHETLRICAKGSMPREGDWRVVDGRCYVSTDMTRAKLRWYELVPRG